MPVLNTEYYQNLKDQIDLVQSCSELQGLTNKTTETMAAEQSALTEQLAAFAPMLALLSLNITNLPSVITFLQDFVSLVLTPYLKPYVTLEAQIVAQLAAMAEVVEALENAASRIPDCSINIPTP